MAKITRSTIKSFIKNNMKNEDLYIMRKSSFDGMTDCVQQLDNNGFVKAEVPKDNIYHRPVWDDKGVRTFQEEVVPGTNDNNLGVNGLWLVGSSRDYFTPYEDETFVGFEISNCCGSSIIASSRKRSIYSLPPENWE